MPDGASGDRDAMDDSGALSRPARTLTFALMKILPTLKGATPRELREQRLAGAFSWLAGLTIFVGFGPLYIVLGAVGLGVFLIVCGAILLGIPQLVRQPRHIAPCANASLTVGVLTMWGIAVFTGGPTSPSLPGMIVVPLFAMILRGRRAAVPWGVVCGGSIVAIFALHRVWPFPNYLPSAATDFIAVAGPAVLALFVGVASALFDEATSLTVDRLESRAEALARAKAAADEAARAKSEFLTMMSHEIRTPMNGIVGLTDLLLLEELSPDATALAAGANEAAHALLDILNGVLELSRGEAGKLLVEEAPFSPRALIEETAALLRFPIHDKDLELITDVDPAIPEVARQDARLVRQILVNLLGNAMKFTDRGRIVLSLDAARVDDERSTLTFRVADTGIGIPAEHRERIFDAFAQGDASMTRRHGGTGLGLAISRQLAHALGATLTVESAVGEGSTFTLTVPARVDAARPPTTHAGTVVLWAVPEPLAGALTHDLVALGCHVVVGDDATAAPPTADVVITSADARDAAPPPSGLAARPRVVVGRARPTELDGARFLALPVRQAELRAALDGACHAAVEAPAPLVAASAARPSGLRVLVAEDNAVNQAVAQRMLERLGHDVVLVENGQDAVAAVDDAHFDVVFMDCQMPVLDGYDATREIRRRHGDALAVIALTAHALDGERERCLAAGMTDYLAKPITPEKLAEVIARVSPSARDSDAKKPVERAADRAERA